MTNRILCILLTFFFLIGSLSSANMESGGIILTITGGKMGTTIATVMVPQKYLTKGNAAIPFEYSIYEEGGLLILGGVSTTSISLPSNLKGAFNLEIVNGDFRTLVKIKL